MPHKVDRIDRIGPGPFTPLIEKYRDFLPVTDDTPRISLREGDTPLLRAAALEAKLNMSLAELKLSVRATNCLESENINTVRDLVRCNEDELLEVRNFGETTLSEVQEKLSEMGIRLGMRVPPAAAAAANIL